MIVGIGTGWEFVANAWMNGNSLKFWQFIENWPTVFSVTEVNEISEVFKGRKGELEIFGLEFEGRKGFEPASELGFYALNGTVEIGAFDINFFVINLKLSISALEEGLPVFFIKDFAKYIMHVFALSGEFSSILCDARLAGVIIGIEENGVASAMPE